MLDAVRCVAAAFAFGFEPDPNEPVSSWVDENFMLPSEVAATPGRYQTARVPFLREILDACGPTDPCDRIVFVKSAQVGATTAMIAAIAHIVARTPGPSMLVLPSQQLGDAFSAEKLTPTLRATPEMAARVAQRSGKDGGARARFKTFPGGFLSINGANSAAELRSRSVRFLFKDEVDGYPRDVEGEGDPSELADKRTTTFHNRKIFEASTPATEPSRIWEKYEAGTRAAFHLPCPFCGHEQTLDWDRLDFSKRGTAEDPVLPCRSCDGLIRSHHKRAMLAGGRWIHEREWRPGLAKSYRISELYSPFVTWAQTVASFNEAKADKTKLKVFVNTGLGEVWKEKGDAPDHIRLWERAKGSAYTAGRAPRGVIFVTAGVDVQADRLEVETVGWGVGERSWSIDYQVLVGPTTEGAVWAELRKLLERKIPAEQGEDFDIRQVCIDSGYLAHVVYAFCRLAGNRAAVKGVPYPTAQIVGRPSPVDINHNGAVIKGGAKVWPVGVHQIKMKLYDRLKAAADDAGDTPDGYCHFPNDYDQRYYQMLSSEAYVVKTVRGVQQGQWEAFGRNEALDCRVYNVAAAYILGMGRLTAEDWLMMAEQRGLRAEEFDPTAVDRDQLALEPADLAQAAALDQPAPGAVRARPRWIPARAM